MIIEIHQKNPPPQIKSNIQNNDKVHLNIENDSTDYMMNLNQNSERGDVSPNR